MPSDFALKTMNRVNRLMQVVSFGKLGWEFGDMPVIELTTIGRKSGQPRAVLLTSPLQEGDAYIVVASRGGDDQHPAWFLNLRDNPDVEAVIKGKPKQSMTARIASAEERARMWPVLTKAHDNYAGYQVKTEREIPLVILEPR